VLWPRKAAEGQGEQNGERAPVLVQNPFRLDSEGDMELELESSPECVLLGSRGSELCRPQRARTSGHWASLLSKEDDDGGGGGGGGDGTEAANPVRRKKEAVGAKKAGTLTVS